jgi:hypothetical protein
MAVAMAPIILYHVCPVRDVTVQEVDPILLQELRGSGLIR